ncbi:telomere repeat-binding factor 4-like [Telopea speciosissima]|uniref:telomere repeat-binding factor 4-like n=1 Tax=Telopea speciosissima TaxID=54955 RepID=UPI001CC4C1CA|nr:telomere repeat-binding factor 4-like [Telopea speciosissima]
MGNPKQKWTTEEEEALRAGVDKHGVGKWKNIQRDPEFGHCLSARSNIDLKDKWRNMSVSASGQGSREKLRTPKVKAVPASATSALTVQSSVASAPVAQDARADSIMDSGPGLQDAKAAPRYNTMIFEALSTLDDPNGSDISSIISYIEQRHEVPQNFRRLLSSKLRRLVAQDKLEKIQNCYKKKEDSSFGTRAPPPKQIRPRQSQNPGFIASVDAVEEAAAAAAYKIAEAESKSFVASGAVAEAEKIAKMAEEAESLVLLAKQIFEQCSRGEIVLMA